MKPKTESKEIWRGSYCSLFDDGTMGFSDGVGFVGGIDTDEIRSMYNALKLYFSKLVKEGE